MFFLCVGGVGVGCWVSFEASKPVWFMQKHGKPVDFHHTIKYNHRSRDLTNAIMSHIYSRYNGNR